MAETEEAIAALESNPNICSESYLSPINGTSAKCSGGVPESKATAICLDAGGFAVTEQGMEEAIMTGWAQVNMEAGGKTELDFKKVSRWGRSGQSIRFLRQWALKECLELTLPEGWPCGRLLHE